ncbi:MAG: hypothetical protein CM15mP125_1730 [Gammaproteobacteria bacterium]|nr:MAG: hypothetical protein CM15mP125_1730 [Gammaproteobacteria bacterium]
MVRQPTLKQLRYLCAVAASTLWARAGLSCEPEHAQRRRG